jgi:SAM-dependent methyltransferase
MKDRFTGGHFPEHDWHSREYVDQWIGSDITRDDERRPVLRQMLSIAPFAAGAEIEVLDVGAGYGVLSEEVLKAFPRARLTLQDYSEPMFEHARRRLANHTARISYILADLTDPAWSAKVGGPFDLVVSGLAVHNLDLESLMKSCYRAIHSVLRAGAPFLDYDLFGLVPGGVDTHLRWLREAGFERAQCTWEQGPMAVIAAWVPSR